ncbi:DUF4261 domain-containing protein [Fusobacterium sp.]|uniref:DUF4261 domain-containing protein n=1 Tax=Fusobacterium sp. TaxID=68766 RepID=UPI00262DE74B|nr:DUF4261 domain-containing protein [Fusobacterium sp.]
MENKNLINGFILFKDKNCDFTAIQRNLKADWNIELNSEIKDGATVFNVGNTMVTLAVIQAPVPNNEAEENAKNNIFWENGVQLTSEHQSHMIVTVSGGKDSVKSAKLFVKIVSSILKLENTIGIYKYPTVIPSDIYIEVADEMKDNGFPVLNMVYIGMYRSDNGICGYTEGLKYFGKKEIEVLDTDVEVFELYEFLIDIANYVITSDVKLNDGETIGFSAEQKLPITLSEGVALEEDTLKIEFNNENKGE